MPNTKPPPPRPRRWPTRCGARRGRMHCDFAFYVGATRENVDELPALERLQGCGRRQGVHGRIHRRPAGRGRAERSARIISRHVRRAPRSTPRTRRGSRRSARLRRRGRPVLASGLARRGGGSDGDAATGAAGRAHRQARARAARLHRRGNGVAGRAQGCGERRGHAASPHAGGARLLRAPRHASRR